MIHQGVFPKGMSLKGMVLKDMIPQDRETLICVGALAALLTICASCVGFSLQARLGAEHQLNAQSDLLAQLEAHSKARKDAGLRSGGVAPAAAFLAAPTKGLANAQLQAYLQRVADDHHAVLDSSGIEPAVREDQPDTIRIQATLDTSLQSLQALLYQLEGGAPYVFVQSLNIELHDDNSQRAVEDPLLRVTLELRSIWRREPQ
jgi:general secretion pathway protein M